MVSPHLCGGRSTCSSPHNEEDDCCELAREVEQITIHFKLCNSVQNEFQLLVAKRSDLNLAWREWVWQ